MLKVKICGVTHPDDALFAALLGADYIGIIFSKRSKRCVSFDQATEIASVIASTHTELVGVFVDTDEQEISDICKPLNISTIQLHGHYSSDQLLALSKFKNIFYAVRSDETANDFISNLSGKIVPLFDNKQPGSGLTFDWSVFSPPSRPWILAGGLNSKNVATVMNRFNPDVVDVASGVERDDSVRKDRDKVRAFISAAKQQGMI